MPFGLYVLLKRKGWDLDKNSQWSPPLQYSSMQQRLLFFFSGKKTVIKWTLQTVFLDAVLSIWDICIMIQWVAWQQTHKPTSQEPQILVSGRIPSILYIRTGSQFKWQLLIMYSYSQVLGSYISCAQSTIPYFSEDAFVFKMKMHKNVPTSPQLTQAKQLQIFTTYYRCFSLYNRLSYHPARKQYQCFTTV